MTVRAALVRLAVALRLRGTAAEPALPASAAPFEPGPVTECALRELSAGTAFLGAPSTPIAKLSEADAERLLGIPVRVLGR